MISWSVHLRYVYNTAAGVVAACVGIAEPATRISTQCSQQAWAVCPPAPATLTLLCCCWSKASTSVPACAAVWFQWRYSFRICLMMYTCCDYYSLVLFGKFVSKKGFGGNVSKLGSSCCWSGLDRFWPAFPGLLVVCYC